MKMRPTLFALLVLLLAITIAITQPSSANAADNGPRAFGQGEFFHIVRRETWRFAFDVSANKKGHARGRATFDIVKDATETQVVVRIDCLNVETFEGGGASAIMSGTVLQSDNPDFPKGAGVFFNADDHSIPIINADLIAPLFLTELFQSEGDCHDLGHLLTVFFVSPDAITIQP
jgi:hypothetical protein